MPVSGSLSDKPITWGTIFRAALIWAPEYVVLSLIEDAPFALKAATFVCSISALSALEGKQWLENKKRNLFALTIGVISVVYIGFVAYGVNNALEQSTIRSGLKRIYTESTPLVTRKITPVLKRDESGKVIEAHLEQTEVSRFKADYEAWEVNSADWILLHLGQAAHDHFLDRANVSSFSCWLDICDQSYDLERSRLEGNRKNILEIMGSPIYAD